MFSGTLGEIGDCGTAATWATVILTGEMPSALSGVNSGTTRIRFAAAWLAISAASTGSLLTTVISTITVFSSAVAVTSSASSAGLIARPSRVITGSSTVLVVTSSA